MFFFNNYNIQNNILSIYFYFIQDLQDESNRFDGEKYLELVKSSSKRNITATDETPTDGDTQENE